MDAFRVDSAQQPIRFSNYLVQILLVVNSEINMTCINVTRLSRLFTVLFPCTFLGAIPTLSAVVGPRPTMTSTSIPGGGPSQEQTCGRVRDIEGSLECHQPRSCGGGGGATVLGVGSIQISANPGGGSGGGDADNCCTLLQWTPDHQAAEFPGPNNLRFLGTVKGWIQNGLCQRCGFLWLSWCCVYTSTRPDGEYPLWLADGLCDAGDPPPPNY